MATESPARTRRHRTLADLYADMPDRTAGILAACAWGTAIVTLVLFAHGWFLGAVGFALVECWTIGSGCLGVPIFISRLFDTRYVTPLTCTMAGLVLAAIALLLTALIGAGQLKVSVLVAAFVIIMPESAAIHAANGALALTRTQRAVTSALARAQAAHGKEIDDLRAAHQREIEDLRAEHARDIQAAHLAGIAVAYHAQHETAEELGELLARPTRELETISDALKEELSHRSEDVNGHSGSARILRLVHQAEDLPSTGSGG